MAAKYQRETVAIILLIYSQMTYTNGAKGNFRPVHEITNEHSRSDTEKPFNTQGSLPYGNPLAGNSQQRTKQHAMNQQAMFNAEKVRQHRAQLQRWTKAPIKLDSYMKAYQASQESHHLALEKQHSGAKVTSQTNNDKFKAAPQLGTVKARTDPQQKQRSSFPEALKITINDAIKNRPDRNRNHRSHGSVETNPIQHKSYYEDGVTIRPHGNAGLSTIDSQMPDDTKLYTTAVPSNIKYIYPRLDLQKQSYKSAADIEALSYLLKKPLNEQIDHFHSLIDHTKPDVSHSINQPIDLYFYLKDAISQSEQNQHNYNLAQEFVYEQPIKDHKPIMETVDDIDNPNDGKLKSYGFQTVLTTDQPNDTTTTKSNNYYKVEVASQTISGPKTYHSHFKHPVEYYINHEDKLSSEALNYGHQPHLKHAEDLNEKYLHHNANYGIQHLNGDGTGVSAYDAENLHYASNYEFGYRVHDQHSGNDFGHSEMKNGHQTNGHYHVLLPDGRMQKVKYSAGPEGFHADISYDHLQ